MIQHRYYVQYQDQRTGMWNNVDSGTNDPRKAREGLLEEAKHDPEYAHRLVKIEETVLAFIEPFEES